VLPNSIGSHVGLEGEFSVLSFPEDEDPDLLFFAYVTGVALVDKPDEVDAARFAFDDLRAKALNPSESVALIRQVENEL